MITRHATIASPSGESRSPLKKIPEEKLLRLETPASGPFGIGRGGLGKSFARRYRIRHAVGKISEKHTRVPLGSKKRCSRRR